MSLLHYKSFSRPTFFSAKSCNYVRAFYTVCIFFCFCFFFFFFAIIFFVLPLLDSSYSSFVPFSAYQIVTKNNQNRSTINFMIDSYVKVLIYVQKYLCSIWMLVDSSFCMYRAITDVKTMLYFNYYRVINQNATMFLMRISQVSTLSQLNYVFRINYNNLLNLI